MKKLTTILIAFALIAVCFCFTACDGDETEYWKDVYNNVEYIIEKDDNKTYIYAENDISYIKDGQDLRLVFEGEYAKLLGIYEETLKANFYSFKNNKGKMQLAPSDISKSKKHFDNFNTSFKTFEKALTQFKAAKEHFITSLEVSTLSSDINNQHLKEYKRAYKKYMTEAGKIIDTFNELYENVYYNPPVNGESATQFSFNALKYKISTVFGKAQIKFLDEYNESNEREELNVFNLKAAVVIDSIDDESDLSFDNYKAYSDYYNLLVIEYNQFVSALEHIDYAECEKDSDAYFASNPGTKVYFDKINYFKNLTAYNF